MLFLGVAALGHDGGGTATGPPGDLADLEKAELCCVSTVHGGRVAHHCYPGGHKREW